MKRTKTLIILFVIVAAFATALIYLWQKNAEDPITYTTESPSEETIIVKTVATGNIVPKEEVLIKSNISGVIEEVFIEAGQYVNSGDLIAKIRVIPNISNLTSAKNSIASNQTSLQTAKINLQTQQANYDRQKALFEKGVISANEFEGIKNTYLQNAHQGNQDWLAKSAIMGALNLYMDFINLFMFLLHFMGNRE